MTIPFTWSFDCPASGQLCSSIRDICLARTLSKAGTWENKIGLSDRASMAGSEREVCGWAAKEMSFEIDHINKGSYGEKLGRVANRPGSVTRSCPHLLARQSIRASKE